MRVLCALAVAAAAVTGGCASSGPTGASVLTGSLKQNSARLVIYRTSPLGFAVQPPYMIDGKAVANSQPNGFIVCDLKPGKRDVTVGNAGFNVNLGGGTDKATLTLVAGKTTYLSAQPQMGLTVGVITITEVTDAQGKADTAGLHKIDGTCPA